MSYQQEGFSVRWPIRWQLLIPFLTVVVGTILVSSAVNAWLSAGWTRRRQEEDLGRLVNTLTNSEFPLTKAVLCRLAGLSGGQFVTLDREDRVLATSWPEPGRLPTEFYGRSPAEVLTPVISQEDLARVFAELPEAESDQASTQFSQSPKLTLGGRVFLAQRMLVDRRPSPGRAAWLVLLYPEDRWWAESRRALYPPLLLGVIASTLVILVVTWLSRRFVKPIEELQAQALAIAGGDFSRRSAEGTRRPRLGWRDELGDLADALDRMAGQLAEYEQRVRRRERLQTLGQIGGGIAHQLRNSVTGALLALELHQQDCPVAQTDEALPVIHRQLTLMQTYLQRFLALGRTRGSNPQPAKTKSEQGEPGSQEFRPADPGRTDPGRTDPGRTEFGQGGPVGQVDLGLLIDEVLPLVRPLGQHTQVEILYRKAAARSVIEGHADTLRQLLVNLFINAVEAAGSSQAPRCVEVSLRQDLPSSDCSTPTRDCSTPTRDCSTQIGDGLTASGDSLAQKRGLRLQVTDTGPGPAANIQDELFEPFVTEKPDGTGLGLAVVREVAQRHGATVCWQRIDQRTVFEVIFPQS